MPDLPHPGSVLVVDDYRPLAEAAATVATMVLGIEADTALPGEALARLAKRDVALVLLNREMKPIAGPALAQSIRHAFPHVSIVMMGSQLDGARARALGANDGIATPFNTTAFRELLERLTASEVRLVAAE